MLVARHLRIVIGLLAVSLLTAARADDWPQFRHDPHRSGLSRDPIHTRLIPLWNWEDAYQASVKDLALHRSSSRPVATPCVWHGRLISLTRENGIPHVVCVDARTGERLWHRQLNSIAVVRDEGGPAITRSGVIYVPDTTPAVERQTRTALADDSLSDRQKSPRNQSPQSRLRYGNVDLTASHVTIRALRAIDGTEIASFVMPAAWPRRALNAIINRIWMFDIEPYNLLLPPGMQSHWRVGEDPMALGPFLLEGDQVSATSGGDIFARWMAGTSGAVFRICHLDEAPSPDLSVPAVFQGFPPLSVSSGVLVLDDTTRRFVGVFGNGPVLQSGIPTSLFNAIPLSGPAMTWHRDMGSMMGIPAGAGDRYFLPIGGEGARRGVLAMEATRGGLLWYYPSSGKPLADTPMPQPPPLPGDGVILKSGKWAYPVLNGRVFGPDELLLGSWGHSAPGKYGTKSMSIPMGGNGNLYLEPLQISPSAQSNSPSGVPTKSLGLVADTKRLFGWCDDQLLGLDQSAGRLLWKRKQSRYQPPTCIIGAKDRLLVSEDTNNFPRDLPHLRCYRMDNGRLEWSLPLPFAGQMVSSYGMVFLQGDNRIFAYAPAERTYRMAIESTDPEEYRVDPAPPAEPPAPEATPGADAAPAGPVAVPPDVVPVKPDPKHLGDAILLRLRWNEPLPEMLKKVHERRRLLPRFPLLLSLDWLNRDRSARLNAATATWSDAEIRRFAETCGHLAAAGKPEHFQVGDEVNVYLVRHPEQRERVKRLVRAARLAIREASPNTQVLVSFNAELLMNVYGRTGYLPFGEVKPLPELDRAKPQEVAEEVEEIGISTRPQSGYIQPAQVSLHYLSAIKKLLRNKPTLVTRLEFRWDDTDAAEITQTQFARKMFQALYWLDARVVAYPDLVWLIRTNGHGDAALKLGDKLRPALSYWQDTLSWTWVPALNAHAPDPLLPFKPDPEPLE